MKPLTLTIYPKSPTRPGPGKGWADWRRDRDRECKQAHEKRFTDAELAAEWWQEAEEYTRTAAQVLYEKAAVNNPHVTNHFRDVGTRCQTLHRFAVSPHYYEEQE